MNLPSTKQLHLAALASLQKTPPIKPHAAPSPSSRASTPRAAPKPAKTISIQHMSVQKVKTNQRVIYDVINYLREIEKPATAEEIHTATGHDIKGIPGVMEALQSNVKISFEDGWFSYKVRLPVSSRSSFFSFIN